MSEQAPAIMSDPAIMSGTPVFVGTRVPRQTLLDYLEAGQPLSEFLEDFPTVSREQAVASLEQAKDPAECRPAYPVVSLATAAVECRWLARVETRSSSQGGARSG